MWKDVSYFSRTQKQGIILLLILIGLITIVGYGFSAYREAEATTPPDGFEEKYAHFAASLKAKDSLRALPHYPKRERAAIQLTAFDPNTTDSATFCLMGLPAWMASNILRYRAKGGVFRKPEDFRKIYGLSDEQYATLLPYIYIAKKERAKKEETEALAKAVIAAEAIMVEEEEMPSPYIESDRIFKYPKGTVLCLNTADTTELKKIPGIGPALSRRITGYRYRLGGYHHISQLKEIGLNPDYFAEWFSIDSMAIKKINLNWVSVKRLKNHPYFNFYQAKAIMEHRRRKGKLKSLEQLKLYKEFTAEDMERIRPYVYVE